MGDAYSILRNELDGTKYLYSYVLHLHKAYNVPENRRDEVQGGGRGGEGPQKIRKDPNFQPIDQAV